MKYTGTFFSVPRERPRLRGRYLGMHSEGCFCRGKQVTRQRKHAVERKRGLTSEASIIARFKAKLGVRINKVGPGKMQRHP